MGGTLIKVELGHGRGWAAPDPARSIARIDRQLGRPADVNEAGRSPEQANKNRAAWLAYERYLKGGPWAPRAPYALGADQSVHCWGGAADSDDWYNDVSAAVWRDNGWRQTARYPGNRAKDEPWHGEHFLHLDNHRHEVVELVNDNGTWRIAPDASALPPAPIELPEEETMLNAIYAIQKNGIAPQKGRIFEIFRDPRTGQMVKNHITDTGVYGAIAAAAKKAGIPRDGGALEVEMSARALDKIPTWKK